MSKEDFRQIVREIKERNAGADPDELQAIIDAAVRFIHDAVRAR